ncbi:hypothetical protein BY458DRAFT_519238 [Sporodiniella umbellata]|nr:hypothetical protein BY458DRAFT_519238 [Sporodiniella umbellata]
MPYPNTRSLPSLSQLSLDHSFYKKHSTSKLNISNLLSSPPLSPTSSDHDSKIKRKRASPDQLAVLNRVFSRTYFPSTELRRSLGKQLGMSPRTVQIWFQNKRQALRTRGRQEAYYFPPVSPPTSPTFDIRRHMSLPPLKLSPPTDIALDYFNKF